MHQHCVVFIHQVLTILIIFLGVTLCLWVFVVKKPEKLQIE
jgi:hypothetical protein